MLQKRPFLQIKIKKSDVLKLLIVEHTKFLKNSLVFVYKNNPCKSISFHSEINKSNYVIIARPKSKRKRSKILIAP